MNLALSEHKLAGLLNPRSIAVLGASARAGNFGGETVRRLRKFGFAGPIWPVNRRAEPIDDVPAYGSLGALPAVPDLVVFAVPSTVLIDAVREAIALGVRSGIAYAGGFAEGEGGTEQAELEALCKAAGFNLCGPNCVGIVNAHDRVVASFTTSLHEHEALRPGGLSIIAQSGGIGTNLMVQMLEAGFGIRYMISSGNEAVVDFSDYLEALVLDPETRVIAAYLEGVEDGPKFVRALDLARRSGKPVALIKVGASEAGARAARAHTGALASPDRIVDAILREAGVMRVHSTDALVDLCLLLLGGDGKSVAVEGNGVGILTFGGGNGVLATDQCHQAGLRVPALSADAGERLRPLLASYASVANPLDMTPGTAFEPGVLAAVPEIARTVGAQPDIDVLLFIVGALADRAGEICEVILEAARTASVPVVVSWPGLPGGVAGRLAEGGLHVFKDPARAIRAIASRAQARRLPALLRENAAGPAFDWTGFADAGPEGVISEDRCHRILAAAGLATAPGRLVGSGPEGRAFAEEIGFPVVLKGISPKITHRAAVGLVAADLRTPEEFDRAFVRLTDRAARLGVALDGIYVQKMQPGVEIFVSALRDPVFGPMVSCASGGVLTELIDDVVLAAAPVSPEQAAQMVGRLRIAAKARDAEGPFDAAPLAAFISGFSHLAASAPWPRFAFEVNPVRWSRDGAVAVDGLIVIEDPAEAPKVPSLSPQGEPA